MNDYKLIKMLKNIPNFELIIKKLILQSSEDPTIMNNSEKVFLLGCAIFLIKGYEKDRRYKSYIEFAYYIILKYAIIFNDYLPLYDFAINFGFYPIAKSLVDNNLVQLNTIENCTTQARIEEEYKHNDFIETYSQKIVRDNMLENKNNELCIVAPTSFGKSSLIIEDIKNNLDKRDKVAIIVPTKSLIIQTFRNLKSEIRDRKIILHDEMYEGEDKFLSVLTQERALRLLQKNEDLYFDTLYIDEAHNLFEKGSRTILLSRLIRINRIRNSNHRVIYLSPLIFSASNLKFDEQQNIVEQRIDYNMKEPEIYILDRDNKISKYNRFFDIFYDYGVDNSYLNYIYNTCKNKNFFYINTPKKIERFSKELFEYSPLRYISNPEVDVIIENLENYVHKDFYGIKYLRKGIVYLHGKLPDHIKEYLEYKFKNVDCIKYLIANSVILEGINLPINCMYILNTRGLSPQKLTNLIGRVNRLNIIFNSTNRDYSLLLPNIHFINVREYSDKNCNMKNKITNLRTGRFKDNVKNPLLINNTNNKNVEDEKIIKEETFILSAENNHLSQKDDLKRKMINLGMNIIYQIDDSLCETLLQRINTKELIETNIIGNISKIFIIGLDRYIIDKEFLRLKNNDAVNYYENFIKIAKKKSIKENIDNIVSHFNVRKNSKNSLMYVGESYGEIKYNEESQKAVYVDLKQKNEIELVNLAIVKLKLENDFISYKLIKFFQLLFDYEILSEDYYHTLVYGTSDKKKINLLKQGLSINIINKLEADNQLDNIWINSNNLIEGNNKFEKYKETLDDFLKFEIDKYFN